MVLSGFGVWGVPKGGGTPFNAQNEEGSADSSKTEGTPPRGGLLGIMFGTPNVAHTYGVYHAF